MKRGTFGALVASVVIGLAGSAAFAQAAGDAKACYRTKCGKSVKGHEGKCGGTKVEGITSETMCVGAGGAWTTAEDAKKYAKEDE